MTRYTDAALLKGDYAHLAAEIKSGKRDTPDAREWDSASCENQAEEAAQEIAKNIFAFQKLLNPKEEQLEVLTWTAAGQMRVMAIMPGEGDILRLDGVLMPEGQPSSLVIHAAQVSLTFLRTPIEKADVNDDGLQIGFVIFDELSERQKARYNKKKKKKQHFDLTKPFGLPNAKPAKTKNTSKRAPKSS